LILRVFLFLIGADKERSKIKKVHFYWVNRDKEAFEWFADLLSELEQNNIGNFLEINVYLTARVSKEDDIKKLLSMEETGVDVITGLQTGTTYGRPPWDKIFLQHAETYQGQTVGVFFCGPKVLSKELAKQCKRHTDTRTKTKFKYNKENF
jgi:NADPH oxidase